MAKKTTLTFAIMDATYENPRSTTALRLMDLAVRRGYDVNVFAYEGAVSLPFAKQTQHPNAIHGRDAEEEDHPNPKDWVTALLEAAAQGGSKIDWVQCGLCVDERGTAESVPGLRRGGPPDFWKFVEESDNTLVIPTK